MEKGDGVMVDCSNITYLLPLKRKQQLSEAELLKELTAQKAHADEIIDIHDEEFFDSEQIL